MSEAEYLESQSDGGAYEDMRELDYYNEQKAKAERNKIANLVAIELKKHEINKTKTKQRGKMVEVKCIQCKESFNARVADRKRGWAKFCSKRCKAVMQMNR